MTKSELPYLDRIFLGPLLMYANQGSKGPFITEGLLLSLILVSYLNRYYLIISSRRLPGRSELSIFTNVYLQISRFLLLLTMHYIVRGYVKTYANPPVGRYLKLSR